MQYPSAFDQLARNLSSAERRELLEKIRAAFAGSPKPLLGSRSEPPPGIDVEQEVSRFSLLKRLVLFLRSLFSNKDRISVVRDMILRDVKRELSHQAGGVINFLTSNFTERMYSELSGLMEALSFFKEPLALALRREKNDFYAYLAGTLLRATQYRLEDEIKLFDPLSESRRFDESVSRSEMLERLEAIVADIPPEQKSRVYKDAQALYYLSRLSAYDFDPLLSGFHIDRTGAERVCDVQSVAGPLRKLANRLCAASKSPSSDALRVLFLFSYKDRLEDEGFDLEEEMIEVMSLAGDSLAAIRRFNDRVPLVLMVRYITRNLDYSPKKPGGAEDWFVIFKEFWRQRIEESYREYQREKKRSNLMKGARDYLGVEQLPALSCYDSTNGDDEARIRYVFSLSFVKAFYDRIFKKMKKPLELILTQGQFYKQQNREEFAETYESIVELGRKSAELESQLGEKGYFGAKLLEIRKGSLGDALKSQQTAEILEEANGDALQLLDRFVERLQKLVQLLAGILHGEPGAKFDTISNLSTLGGGENALISSSWENALKNASQGANLLRDIRDLESD